MLETETLNSDERRHLNLKEIKAKFESLDNLILADDNDPDNKIPQ